MKSRERGTRGGNGSSQGGHSMNIHHNPQANNRYTGQEHSVERLKSCIADLKKLATSKVKKTSGGNGQNIHNEYEKY